MVIGYQSEGMDKIIRVRVIDA